MTLTIEEIIEEVKKLLKDEPTNDDIKMLIDQIDSLDQRLAVLEAIKNTPAEKSVDEAFEKMKP